MASKKTATPSRRRTGPASAPGKRKSCHFCRDKVDEIDHKAEGSYHLLHFTSEPATLDEISRVLRIEDDVMRHMATRRIEGSPARPVAPPAPARDDGEAAGAEPETAPESTPESSPQADQEEE
jgi:hypothetical protein